MLPKVPQWKSQIISFPGFATKDPIELYFRDSIECLEQLFSNPLFDGHIDYQPRRVFKTPARDVRKYSEWMTSEGAWEMQVSLCARITHLISDLYLE